MQRKKGGGLPGKIFARCILQRRFAGLFAYMARISCHRQLISDTWRRYVAREGRFSRSGPLRGCMKRENCRGRPPRNAPGRNIAIARRPGPHRGEILPSPSTRERTVASRSREAPRERNVDQFNNVRRPVQETVKIFWCLPPRNCAENMLAYHGEHERKRYLHQQHQ